MIEVWGLTGGIASGKSEVARLFAAQGFPVIDADQVSRELSAPGGAAHAAIVRRFGTADRAALRKIVFADPSARRDLEALLHPLIVAESTRRISEAQKMLEAGLAAGKLPQEKPSSNSAATAATLATAAAARCVIYEAALLVETGRSKQFTGLIVVDASAKLRRERLITRDGVAPELADRILAAQIGDAERLAAATAVIPNHGTLTDLRAAVQAWIAQRVAGLSV